MTRKAVKTNSTVNSRAAIEAVRRGLTESASPTRVARALERFIARRDRTRQSVAPPSLPESWARPYTSLLSEITDIVKKPFGRDALFTERMPDGLRLTAFLDSFYGPAGGGHLAGDHRYTIEWTYRDNTDTAGSQVASKATGHLHVVNVLSPLPPAANQLGSFTGGTAHAGVGFLFRPKFALTKLTMTPHVLYNYHYIVDHPTNATLSVATTRGTLRLVAYRVNPFNKTAELHAGWSQTLWDVQNQPIASRHEGQHQGVFNGFPVQLDFTAWGDFLYAVLCVATVYVGRGYYGGASAVPPEPTLCTGNLECDVAGIWLEQEA